LFVSFCEARVIIIMYGLIWIHFISTRLATQRDLSKKQIVLCYVMCTRFAWPFICRRDHLFGKFFRMSNTLACYLFLHNNTLPHEQTNARFKQNIRHTEKQKRTQSVGYSDLTFVVSKPSAVLLFVCILLTKRSMRRLCLYS